MLQPSSYTRTALGAEVIAAHTNPVARKVLANGSDTVLSLSTIEHINKHFLRLNELRLSQQLCDITLIVGDREIAAHKNVLSTSSAYFLAMFTSDMVESKSDTVPLHDLDADAVESIIDFVYTAQLPEINDSNVQEMLSAASLLQVEEIERSCCNYLTQQLDASNCLDIRDIAEKYSCLDLLTAADDFALDAFEEVIENDEFLKLPVTRLIGIISDDRLNVKSEEHVYGAVMRWISYKNGQDDDDRNVHLANVLRHVRFSQMSPDHLVEVSENSLIKSRERCREDIDEAKNYFLSYRFQPLNVKLPQVLDRFSGEQYRPRKKYSTGEKLYVVGGYIGSSPIPILERYDLETNSWTRLADMIRPRIFADVGVLNGVLYVIGGKCDGNYLKSIESYHIDTDKWTSDVVAPLSFGRSSMRVATLKGFLYAIGGQKDYSHYLKLVEKYDPISNRWSSCSPLATARCNHGVATLDGYIYVLGGYGPNRSPLLNLVERYDPNLDRWQSLAPMMTARYHLGCAAFGGYIYAIGGRDGLNRLASVERYDPSKDIWEWMPPMAKPRSHSDAAVVNGLLHVVGGFDGSWFPNTVEVYDPDLKKWSFSSASIVPHARTEFRVFVSK